jgi:hypothetical protein
MRRGRSGIEVVGSATDYQGRPLTHVTLALGTLVGYLEGGGLKFTTTADSPRAKTNSRGDFRFENVAPNRYVLHLPRNGYLRPEAQVLEVTPGGTGINLHAMTFRDVRGDGYREQ